MGQAEPAYQAFLRDIRECSENTNLDSRECLVLAAIIKKELKLEISLYTFLQILSVRPFEKLPLPCAFLDGDDSFSMPASSNQLNLFES